MDPESPLKQIRTYQGDVADALGRQNESLVCIKQQEALKRRTAGIPAEPAATEIEMGKKKNDFLFLLIGSVFFIIVGTLGAWFGYREYTRRTAPPAIIAPESRLISPDRETEINISLMNREDFTVKFAEIASGAGDEELVHLVARVGTTTPLRLATTAELFSLLQSRASGSLVRAFDKVFMLGVVGKNPFILVKLASFENAFAGMLAWENIMAEDLLPLFSASEELKVIAPGYVFRDVTVRNKDVRALYASSTPVLLYSFFDNNFLIITDSFDALQTLIDRLTRERLSR